MTDVTGRTAFITGGANGIGLGIARALAKAGVNLGLADIDADALEKARAELAAVTKVATVVLDVRDREAYAKAVDDVEDKLGPISLLFNNAGVAGGAPASKLTYELWDWGLGINLGGVVNGVQTVLPRILARGAGGHIVNTASGAGLVGTPSGSIYCTSKFAVVGMSEALNAELAAAGVGVSVLCPGPVATDIVNRSAGSKPTNSAMSTAEQEAVQARNTMMTAVLANGVPADVVGDMVLEAIMEGRFYIHTDRMMEPYLEARHAAIIAALPST